MSLKVSTVGIIGGGQLGMFLAHSCSNLGLRVFVYSDSKKVPAEKYADKMFYGSFEDIESLKIFSSEVDLITYEFENVSTKALKKLKGLDSLLSIAQMPAGVPVGSLAVGESGAKNAALLAISILSGEDKILKNKYKSWRLKQTQSVNIKPKK